MLAANEINTQDYQSTLSYYKDKVDSLAKERLAWLSKFDESSSKLQQKHSKQAKLKNLRDETQDCTKSILHHSLALFDERAHAISLQRQNKALEFEDAEQILKMRELSQEYPTIIEKQLPCSNVFLTDEVIKNDLNLHTFNDKQKKATKKKGPAHESKESSKKIVKPSPTFQSLLKQQIIETKNSNDQEIRVMHEEVEALENMIQKVKREEKEKLPKEQNVIDQINKRFKDLDKKHKKLAEDYFNNRRMQKKKLEDTQKENQTLKETQASFEEKVENQIRMYEKQNKAKQTLILRKSGDFQEDYKARMRAKQRNLQALKENYEKMQELCITKVRKLEATLERAKNMYKDAEESRKFSVEELREELRILEKKNSEQRIEKAKLDMKVKEKMEEKRMKEEVEREKMEKTRRVEERNKQILTAYEKTKKGKRQASKSRERKKKEVNDDDSLDMSDLDNIREQIHQLEKKITEEDKHYS